MSPSDRKQRHFIAKPDAKPVQAKDVMPEMMRGPDLLEALGLTRDEVLHVKAKELIGDTFTIYAGRSFPSKDYPNQEWEPWFLVCQDEGEWFTTVLGGQVTGEALEAWRDEGSGQPLTVTLEMVEGERFNYYVFDMGSDDEEPEPEETAAITDEPVL